MVYNYNEKAANVITPEMLSQVQQDLAHEYIRLTAVDGIFVGALLGAADWDVRPLVLDRSGLSRIIRFSDPNPVGNIDFILEMYQHLQTSLPHLETGIVGKRFYQIRPFFQSTLSDVSFFQRSTLGVAPEELLLNLFEDCVKWRHKGFVHGHISLSNIAIRSGKPCLFDFAFAALSKDNDVAPELLNGAGLSTTTAADIYGLGKVSEVLLGDSLSAEQRDLIAAMQSSSPNNRPSLLDSAKILFPNSKLTSQNSVLSLKFGDDASLKLGRILGTNLDVGKTDQSSQNISEKSEAPQVSSISNNQKSQGSLWPFIILLLLLSSIVYYFRSNQYTEVPEQNVSSSIPENTFEEAWQSSIPSVMRPVAEAAVAGNKKARIIIVKDIFGGAVKPNVQHEFLKVALNPNWEQELTEQDRDFIFHFALVKIVGGGKMPRIEELHPGVIYALLATLPSVNDRVAKLDDMSTSKLASVPGQVGSVFRLIGKHKLTEPFVKAIARLLIGKSEPQTLTAFFAGVEDQKDFVMRLSLLKEVLGNPYSDEEILIAVKQVKGWASEQLKWLDSSSVFDSASLSDEFKLSFLSGNFPSNTVFKLGECADFLRLQDNSEVTALAAALLSKKYLKEDDKETILVLLSPDLKLSRKQVVDFITTLGGHKQTNQSKLFATWFETKPDQDDVVKLVAARCNFELDPFSLVAVDYLRGKELHISNSDLAKLVVHKEILVRVLAYSKLNPVDPIHLKILLKGLKSDPNKRVRKLIEEKLADYGIQP